MTRPMRLPMSALQAKNAVLKSDGMVCECGKPPWSCKCYRTAFDLAEWLSQWAQAVKLEAEKYETGKRGER